MESSAFIRGWLEVVLTGPDGEIKSHHTHENQITQVGEQMYGERGAGISGAVAAPTGMALGTGTTTATKTNSPTAGAALGTPTSGSAVAVNVPSSSIPGTVRRITYVASWPAGTATATGLAEVVLQNGTATTVPTAGDATKIIARALLSPTVNKGSADTLTITWNHDIGT